MSQITTHVLDVSIGRPAAGVPVVLAIKKSSGAWQELSRGATDGDGRLRHLLAPAALVQGIYRLTFDTACYFESRRSAGFYPEVAIEFEVRDAKEHYHVPLLLSPYGYSTYRGS
ncbi:MAG: hydroxyisourate hydrolase [Candidatus Acidiferrales bacterium]